MLHNEIAFPAHEGLPFRPDPPAVDGFVEPEPGVATAMTQIESGYTHGSRFTYGGDSGIPIGVFQAVKHNSQDYLYLSFAVRFDHTFDDLDFVMIVLRPDFNAGPSAADRRIDIHPVSKAAVGAPGGTGTTPGDVRADRAPSALHFFKRDTSAGTAWTRITNVQNFDVKVRSTNSGSALCWSVEIKIPTKPGTAKDQGGADWVDLTSHPTIGFYYDIAQFWDEGGGSYAVQSPWPFDATAPTDNIIVDPAGSLEADWDAPAVGKGFILAPGQANPAKGIKFQQGASSIGVLGPGGAINSTLDAHEGRSNTLVGRIVNTDDVPPAGPPPPPAPPNVRALFRIADFGLPGTPGFSTSATWLPITDTPGQNNVGPNPTTPTPIPPGGPPTDLTLSWTMTSADFNHYKNLWSDQCLWVQLDSPTAGVNFVENSVRRNLTVLTASSAKHPARIQGAGFGKSKTGGGRHTILLHVSKFPLRVEGDSGIHTRGPSNEEMWIRNNYSPLLLGLLPPNMQPKDGNGYPGDGETDPGGEGGVVGWMTIVNAYQVTNKTITAGKKKHKVVVHGGSYAYVTSHVLSLGESITDVELSHKLELDPSLAPSGASLKYHGKGMYRASLPENSDLVITNVLTTGPPGFAAQDEPPIDTSPDDGKPGCLAMLFAIPIIGPILRAILEPILKP